MTTKDPRQVLAEWKALAEGATEGPWEASVEDGFFGHAFVLTTPSRVVRLRDGLRVTASGEFIAASRTAVPALVKAVEAVLALHQPVNIYPLLDLPGTPPDLDAEPIATLCAGCSPLSVLRDIEDCEWTEGSDDVPWPCPTVRAITDALTEEDR